MKKNKKKIICNKYEIIALQVALLLCSAYIWYGNVGMFFDLRAAHKDGVAKYYLVIANRSSEVGKDSRETTHKVTAPTVASSSDEGASTPSTVEDKICGTFPEDCDRMLAIAKAENRTLDEAPAPNTNKDGSIDCGLMQINSIHGYDCEWLENIDNNLLAARKIYDTQGITAWSTYNSGKYLEFIQS